MKVRFQLGNDRLSHGAGRWLQDIVTGLWEETRSSGSCVAPEGLKKWGEKEQKFTAAVPVSQHFLPKSSKIFSFFKNKLPKVVTTLHTCVWNSL